MKNEKQVKNSCSEENNDAKQNNSINNFSGDLAFKDQKKNENAKGLEDDSECSSKNNSETVAENDLPALSDEENANESSEKKESENESPSGKESKEKTESPEKGKIKKELTEESAGNSEEDKNPAEEGNSEEDKNPAEEGNSEEDKNPAEEGNSEDEEENEPEGILSLWRSRDKSSVSPAELLRRHSEGNSQTAKQLAESLSRIQAFCNGSQITSEALDKALEIMFDISADSEAGVISEEGIRLLVKAMDYDSAIERARAEGEIEGRNALIEAKFRNEEDSEGVPSLGGSAASSSSRRPDTIFDLASFAR